MAYPSNFNLSLHHSPPPPVPPPQTATTSPPKPINASPKSDSLKFQSRKFSSSSQLSRWSRARSIRSRKKFQQTGGRVVDSARSVSESVSNIVKEEALNGESVKAGDDSSSGKSIYVVSDGTGWTAEHTVNAALGQFEHCLVDRVCPVNTHLFSGIDDGETLIEIIKQAAKEGALVAYTLADPSMAEAAKQACNLWGIPSTDLLGPITEAVSSHLGVSPSGLPRGAPGRKFPLSEEYFKRIEAIEFTIKQDDGALPQNLHKADIVLAGVSRTGKTPLSIYLSQKGYKVANVPIVVGVELPKALFLIDAEKVFGLTISPVALQSIRKSRAKAMLLTGEMENTYSEMDHVRKELEFARRIFAQNPVWPVIDVTEKAIEETAAVVLRHHHDRNHKYSMPRISKRY